MISVLLVGILALGILIIAKNQKIEDVFQEVESTQKKKIAITFDDGPHPKYTEILLEGLKERNVVANFFVTGYHAELHPEIVKRMKEDGHLIGNHTYSHIQLTKTNGKEFVAELQRTNDILYEITEDTTEYVRPPYGVWDKRFEEELNMFPVMWTIDPEDWNKDNAASIARSVIKKADENEIILMHDYFPASIDAAFLIIDELLKDGYEFVTVDEILFD